MDLSLNINRFVVNDKIVQNALKTEKILHNEGLSATIILQYTNTIEPNPIFCNGMLRFHSTEVGKVECELNTLEGKTFITSFTLSDVATMGICTDDECLKGAAINYNHNMYIKLHGSNSSIVLGFESTVRRDKTFISLLILASNALGKSMSSLLPKNISVDIDLSNCKDGVSKVEGVVGDNIEYLVYLDLPLKGNISGVSWRPRLVVATRETLKIFNLPPVSKRTNSLMDETHFAEVLAKYFIHGGFNDEVMADMDFEIETSVEFSSIFHIVPSQIGSNCLVEITYQIDENEDGDKLVFRATSMIKRNQALEGLYNAFKKRRRGKMRSTTDPSASAFR